MANPFTILNVLGPYREPREPCLSYDFSVQRPSWPTPQGVRVKISLEEELGVFKDKILQLPPGSPGQQLRVNQILSSALAHQKLQIANEEGMFDERRDVMIDPFNGPLAYLAPRLEAWMRQEAARLRQEIKEKVKL
ncbi:MAG: hypothetical protein D6704_01625 [Nitrospirae bacterium]|nr:MAG: hypothetical protein D6704_01625 [Nitrospirota bacterium]